MSQMRCLSSLALVALLNAGSGGPTLPSSPVVPEAPGKRCELTPAMGESPGTEHTALPATVTGIDRARGILEVETEAARAQVVVPSEVLQGLQVGDRVKLCMADEEPRHNLLQDSIAT
jgi:hypothetical protein